MKKVRVRVVENCFGDDWWFVICEGKKGFMSSSCYERKGNAIRFAKAIAEKIGIPYDPKIIKQHGC